MTICKSCVLTMIKMSEGNWDSEGAHRQLRAMSDAKSNIFELSMTKMDLARLEAADRAARAFEVLGNTMEHPDAAIALRAAEAILDRTIGRPHQSGQVRKQMPSTGTTAQDLLRQAAGVLTQEIAQIAQSSEPNRVQQLSTAVTTLNNLLIAEDKIREKLEKLPSTKLAELAGGQGNHPAGVGGAVSDAKPHHKTPMANGDGQ